MYFNPHFFFFFFQNYQFLTALSPPRLSHRPSSVSLMKSCPQGDSKCSPDLSLIYYAGPYFPTGESWSILSTSSLHFSSCTIYSAFNTALIAVYLGYGNNSDETKRLQKFTLLLCKIILTSLPSSPWGENRVVYHTNAKPSTRENNSGTKFRPEHW